jgi:hypothetical protein
MALVEIPTGPSQRTMSIALAGQTYFLRLAYADAEDAGWFMDVSDTTGNPIACGLPLVTGADLLAQLAYLGLGGEMLVVTDAVGSSPTFDGMGTTAHLIFGDTASAAAVALYLDGFLAS